LYYQLADSNVRIAGSMHLIPAGRPLPLWVSPACNWSNRLFLEHDNDPSIFTLPRAHRASADIPAPIWQKVSALLSGRLEDEPKLWTICVRLALRDLTGYALGVEPFARKFAADTDRTIEFLETASDFATLLDAVDSSLILSTMPPLLEDDAPRKNLQLVTDMYDAWYECDAAKFDRIFSSTSLMKIAEIRAAMIDLRNENWVSRIELLLKSDQNTLIIVGAGHLAGDQGLLSLLGQRGIESIAQS
jgi:uncharacterized protein YbaP (TraB family)